MYVRTYEFFLQIDLAHHPMYSTSPMFATNTITGVTMSHPSQMATFTTPPLPSMYAHKLVSVSQSQNLPTAMVSVSAANVHTTIGGGGGIGGGMMPIHLPPPHHTAQQQQQQSIICASQKRPQSPSAASSHSATGAGVSASATTTLPSSSMASSCSVSGVGGSILNLQGNGSILPVNSMGGSGVYLKEAVNIIFHFF